MYCSVKFGKVQLFIMSLIFREFQQDHAESGVLDSVSPRKIRNMIGREYYQQRGRLCPSKDVTPKTKEQKILKICKS